MKHEDRDELRQAILQDIRLIASNNGGTISRDQYRSVGQFSGKRIDRVFGSWTNALIESGLQLNTQSNPYDRVRSPGAFVDLVHPQSRNEKSPEYISQKIADEIKKCSDEMNRDPSTLTWYDFQEYAKVAWGKNGVGITPRDITRVGGFNTIRDAYFPPAPSPESEEKNRLKEHAALHRKLGVEAVRKKFELENLEEFAERVFSGRLPTVPPSVQKESKRAVIALISDTHIGADLRSDETGGMGFGVKEESRRMAFIFREICSYKKEYRKDTELHLILAGDIIQGLLHDFRDGAVLAEQQARAIHLIMQAIALVAQSYHSVTVHCTTGNHGRNKHRHHDRATFQKYDSHETVIYYALRVACRSLENVRFNIPKTPFVTFEVFGKKYFATHGDTVLKPGTPWKNIATGPIENQINKINASLPDADEYSVFMVGHVHIANVTFLGNGAAFISNGPMIPSDNFAVSIGSFESACGQWVFEAVEGHPVGDLRLIRVDSRTDQDNALDAVIEPWTGF